MARTARAEAWWGRQLDLRCGGGGVVVVSLMTALTSPGSPTRKLSITAATPATWAVRRFGSPLKDAVAARSRDGHAEPGVRVERLQPEVAISRTPQNAGDQNLNDLAAPDCQSPLWPAFKAACRWLRLLAYETIANRRTLECKVKRPRWRSADRLTLVGLSRRLAPLGMPSSPSLR